MDIEFHYYITGIIAKKAGFSEDEARTIAYASQYVDDNDVVYEVIDRATEAIYSNYISQTLDILKPKKALMRIYPVFHFVPGDPATESARRRDGKMHILNTTPDSEIVNNLLSEAFKSYTDTRLYRIGIATHAFADSWAHQNFAGFNDTFNGEVLNPIPNIGHAECKHHPDWVAHKWEDDRLVEREIDNNLRFLTAAKRLFEKYAAYTGSEVEWKALEGLLVSLMGRSRGGDWCYGRDERIRRYQKSETWLSTYREETWFDDAIEREVRGLEDSRNGILERFTLFKDRYWWSEKHKKEDTDWYKFQEAVKEHQDLALGPVSKVCNRMGIDIRYL